MAKVKKQKYPLQVKNLTSGNKSADLYIYGEIVDDKWFANEVDTEDVLSILSELETVKNINIYLNSPGGNIYAAIAIFNLLARLDAVFKVYIDGIGASSATYFLSLATPENRIMPANTALFYHNPMSGGYGYAEDLRKAADDLDKHKEIIMSMYGEQFKNLSSEEISTIMANETVVTANMALEFGIITEIAGSANIEVVENNSNKVINSVEFDSSNYKTLIENFAVTNSDETSTEEQITSEETTETVEEPTDYTALENSIKLTEAFISLY